ncbi:MAG: LacI family DNA-binding transcriptional regulator [Lachnospiraceae bacterium]|nr:LacI family DNA-binding transcriptional regulator [Lachnospiraceae bacterium]
MHLKDIAAEAGVSISTVSRVINNPDTPIAGPETKQLILSIAEKAGYHTPAQRKIHLKGPDKPDTKQVLYCLLVVDPQEYTHDMYTSTIMKGLREAAAEFGYEPQFYFPVPTPEGMSYAPPAETGSLILIGRITDSIVHQLSIKNMVYIGMYALNAHIDQVIFTGTEAAQEAVTTLIQMGHKNIGFIGYGTDHCYRGFEDAFSLHELPVNADLLHRDAESGTEGGFTCMDKLLHLKDEGVPVSAVFCSNDLLAMGALQACKERNIRVPEEINLTSLGGNQLVKLVSPTITSIKLPVEDGGRLGVSILFDRIRGGHSCHLKTYLSCGLEKGETGPTVFIDHR